MPDLADAVRAGVLVSGGAGTCVLDNGVEVMLPEDDPAAALATVGALDAEQEAPVARDRRGRPAAARPS